MPIAMISDELDLKFYRAHNPDLRYLTDNELHRHYVQFGRAEGRPCAAASFRKSFVQAAGRHSSILEIGPFFRPSLTGSNVSYFDVLDSEGLRERAKQLGLPTENIPTIHHTSPTGNLSTIETTFQAIFSAHVIEHQACLVTHLKQVSRLLTYGSSYFLVIPDKRYCFDHFIAESTIADILNAYYDQRCIHTLGSVIEHDALTTHNDAQRHWQGDHEDPWFREGQINRVQSALNRHKSAQGTYIDVHAWQFVPATFRSIIAHLYSLACIDLYPVTVYDTPYGRQEFTAVLTKLHR